MPSAIEPVLRLGSPRSDHERSFPAITGSCRQSWNPTLHAGHTYRFDLRQIIGGYAPSTHPHLASG
jgi:hypothetical protein